jgi:hypothetical protein
MSAAHVLNMSDADYHADLYDGPPSLSSSLARAVWKDTDGKRYPGMERILWAGHPRLGNEIRSSPTTAMDDGSIIHALVFDPLGAGAENSSSHLETQLAATLGKIDANTLAKDERAPFVRSGKISIFDYANWKKKAAQAARDGERALGQIPVLRHHYEHLHAIGRRILLHLGRSGYLDVDGTFEQAVFWDAGACWARMKADHTLMLRKGRTVRCVELKTTSLSVHPSACMRRVANDYGDIQAAAYIDGLSALHPGCDVEFVWAFAQMAPPYAITLIPCDGTFQERGRLLWTRTKEIFGECLARGTDRASWPGSPFKLQHGFAPPWVEMQIPELE